jgi:hypothetical protein
VCGERLGLITNGGRRFDHRKMSSVGIIFASEFGTKLATRSIHGVVMPHCIGYPLEIGRLIAARASYDAQVDWPV